MSEHVRPSRPPSLTLRITQRDDPVAHVTDADTWDRHRLYPNVVLRGPVFGFAEQAEGDEGWRLLNTMSDGFPQDARDGLNSHLWFKARDHTDQPAQRRELLDAVALLETEPVNELSANGVRYRIVRGDEFARIGPDGMEPPRPTDPEPVHPDWNPGRETTPSRVQGVVIDHDRPVGPVEALGRQALHNQHYTAPPYPRDVREDSARALGTHPGVVLLPTAFTFAEEKDDGWEPMVRPQPTPHDARVALAHALEEFWPQIHHYGAAKTAAYAAAAADFRAGGHGNTLRVDGRCFHIVRTQTLVRIAPDGPEGPRPSDVDVDEPMRMHPPMDEHGVVTYDT
jgi:hypothetical protein